MIIYLLPILAYCFGSICCAIIVCRMMGLPDPTTSGSNNPGATNVLRIGGKKAAIITLLGDVLKGLIPIIIVRWITDDPVIIALSGIGAFLGHLFPVFFGFKGGKGVATAVGVFAGVSWWVTLILFGVWLAVAVLFRYSSLAALTAAATAPILTYILIPEIPYTILSAIIALLLFIRHRENITRLIGGNESKINFSK